MWQVVLIHGRRAGKENQLLRDDSVGARVPTLKPNFTILNFLFKLDLNYQYYSEEHRNLITSK